MPVCNWQSKISQLNLQSPLTLPLKINKIHNLNSWTPEDKEIMESKFEDRGHTLWILSNANKRADLCKFEQPVHEFGTQFLAKLHFVTQIGW